MIALAISTGIAGAVGFLIGSAVTLWAVCWANDMARK